MRLVADTNVIVSGLLWLGNPGRILEAAASGQVTLYTSPPLLAELAATLGSPKLAQRTQRSGLALDELLARYANVAVVVQPAEVGQVIIADPDDDQVLACALAAQADFVVSGDSHLLALKAYASIPILAPADAIQVLGLG